jgi:hypothetical protein
MDFHELRLKGFLSGAVSAPIRIAGSYPVKRGRCGNRWLAR